MLFLYHPKTNTLVRSVLKPFSGIIPSKFKFPINGTFPIKLDNKVSITLTTNPTSFLARLLFWDGVTGFEYETVRIFMELVKKSNCFFDIGANIGYYSLVAAAFNPKAKIVGFEPLPAANKFFKLNVQHNRFNNVTVEQMALSNFSGKAQFSAIKNPKFSDVDDQLAGDGGLSEKFSGTRSVFKFEVQVETLDDYIKTHLKQGEKIDLIKLDTEASEHLVLGGAKTVLTEHRPIIQCEVLPGQIENELQTIFGSNSYLFFRALTNGLKKVDTLLDNHDHNKDYFMVPAEREAEVKSFLV